MGSKRLIVLVLLMSGAALGLLCSAGRPMAEAEPGRSSLFNDPAVDFVPGELIVGFEGSVAGVENRRTVVEAAGATFERDLLLPGYSVVEVGPGEEQVSADVLLEQGGVVTAEPNLIRRAQFVPNDEFYDLQWNIEQIGLEDAWDYTRGAGVTVAVLDGGVAYENCSTVVCGREFTEAPDYVGTQFVSPRDSVDSDSHPNDQDGHGTHVASTIAESADNGLGAAGIAPSARVMPVRVLGLDTATAEGTLAGSTDDIVDGLIWAANQGARVVNMSFGGVGAVASEQSAVAYAQQRGVLLVAATGNQSASQIGCPACYPGVIAVGATRLDKTLAPYSNYGSSPVPGHAIVMVAPGGDTNLDQNGDGWLDGILQQTFFEACSLDPVPLPQNLGSFTYCAAFQGTSMAAPHVAGVAALVLGVNPQLTALDVWNILTSTAEDLGAQGPDIVYGYGLVNAAAAVQAAIDSLPDSNVRGDASCNRIVSATDAALILQFDAGVIGRVGCPHNADVNDDGRVGVLDATLILQFDAGIIHDL